MTLTPSETEILKMFDERFPATAFAGAEVTRKAVREYHLTQLRLARTDERKQAYEDGKNAAVEWFTEIVRTLRVEKPNRKEEQCAYEFKKNIVGEVCARLLDALSARKA